MPYQDIADLPDSVKNHLPKHAKEIFLAAFNHALSEYGEEETAFKVAWASVKRDYEKGADDEWHKKPE
ncbi:ChaB family protein [Tolypothrix tenuis PCC 7101]|uniref:ChaB family protein n=1 Tax=Tolypothrix tenuis PCC 7101 TaxID=231146 RepID=A0A1Z4MY36_9CYAN|nr:ChaB family protein [Aulosira sp. FACHB-113]BAY98395.1 ChaB family protein [Tolypothrix tenuis PCC 7101]BAZ77686.1 ChaB family protein [Aulosira laxa NIES-50]